MGPLREYTVIVGDNTTVMNLNEADALRLDGTPVRPEPAVTADPARPIEPEPEPTESGSGRPEPDSSEDKGRRAPNKARTPDPVEYKTVDR